MLGAGGTIENGENVLALRAVLACPGEASIDERVAGDIGDMVFADQIRLQSRQPVIVAGTDQCQRVTDARHIDIPGLVVERVARDQRFRGRGACRRAGQRHLGDAVVDRGLPVRLMVNW